MDTYLYAFNEYAWFDRIFLLNNAPESFEVGDLVSAWTNTYLVLWQELSFSEIYDKKYSWTIMPTLLYKSFCSIQTIQLIHWMVYEWYTTYKNVVKLFFDQEIDSLLWKEIKPKKGKMYHSCKIWNQIITWEKYQTLIVFPDIRTFLNIFPENKFEGTFLYSLDSQAKKNKNRWNIKTGNENLIATTSSEIFQDYNNLKKIYFIEPQKWYYAAQQDPRYKVDMVINKLAELYQAEFLTISSENLFN